MSLESCTSCMADTRASHSASQARAEGMTTNATCGRTCSELCEKESRIGWLVRMLEATLPSASMPFAMTWKRQATKQGRSFSRLSVSARAISGSGFLLLPTPRAMPGNFSRVGGKIYETSLQSMARRGLLAETCGDLHPEFLEWVMGFPIGWTELGRSETP